ncbi:MAG: DNA methyltransferase [Alphaproteobacteria bacterium]|nr:DNA methyltransferase [Alphaproteobacteria bacterium]
MKNFLYYGDNLEILRQKDRLRTESIDLCYIDPPFNSKRDYNVIYEKSEKIDFAQSKAFEDTWSWGRESEINLSFLLDNKNLYNKTISKETMETIKGFSCSLGKNDLFAYLVAMTVRIIEIHRVLKSSGSFYLHCDPTASHYLKIICDSIFLSQGGQFLNEIIWYYKTGGASKNWYSKKHDVILLYTKSKSYTFNELKVKSYLQHKYGFKNVKIYNDDKGSYTLVKMRDVWDIPALRGNQPEKLNYDTQKPLALLENVIKISSNEGDVVLDAFCGCGTTVVMAEKLNRKWIGIDITYQSIGLVLQRLKAQFENNWSLLESSIEVSGIPKDIESAKALSLKENDKTRKEFEKWAILTYADHHARINDNYGKDGGIDGYSLFLIDKETEGSIVYQVKSGKVSRDNIATLNSDRQRVKAELAIFITLNPPTKSMIEEARACGHFIHPLSNNKPIDVITIVTVEELLNGKRINMPWMKNATLIKKVEESKSTSLFSHPDDDGDSD